MFFLLEVILAIRNLAFRRVKLVILSILVFCAAKQITTSLMAHKNTAFIISQFLWGQKLLSYILWYWLGLGSYLWVRLERNHFQVHSGCWQNSFCCSCRTESFSFLLAGIHAQILEVICNLLPGGPPHAVHSMAACFPYLCQKGENESASKTESFMIPYNIINGTMFHSFAIKCNVIAGMIPHCLILLIRSKLQVPPTLKGKGLFKGMNTKRWGSWGLP